MKKLLSTFLTLILVLSVFPSSFAAENELNNITLNFDLTYDGEHTQTVEAGTVITVDYNLENITSDEDFTIQSVSNEIYFDRDFFDYLGDEKIEKGIYTANANITESSWKELRVNFNGSHLNKQFYSAKQYMGSFQLRVKSDATGSSTISSKLATAYDNDNKKYTAASKDLTIIVGSQPAEKYVVTYMSDEKEYKSVEVAGSYKLTSAPPIPDGYSFGGWRCSSDGKIYQPNAEYNVTKDVTFTAVWNKIAKKYMLTFDTNGGTQIDSVTNVENTVIDLSAYTPSKFGYTFKGWFSDAALTNKVTKIVLDKNKTVYAKWEKKSTETGGTSGGGGGGGNGSGGGGNSGSAEVTMYTLSFVTNGGTSISSVSKIQNTTVDLSKYITKRDGFSFDGWHTDEALTNKVTEVKMTKNITLYAKWVKGDNGYVYTPNYTPDIFTDNHYSYIVGRDGGYIYPNSSLTRAEAAEIIYRLLKTEVRDEVFTKENSFADVHEQDWFNASVSSLARLGVISGRDAETFAPNDEITRAELTTIVARLSDAEYTGEDLFSDISEHWARAYINNAASIGWVSGDNGMFRPNDNITRAEVITLINKVLNRQPESNADLHNDMMTPPDNTNESTWYYLAIQEAVNSHNYERKADNIHEKWTELTENPNWASKD